MRMGHANPETLMALTRHPLWHHARLSVAQKMDGMVVF